MLTASAPGCGQLLARKIIRCRPVNQLAISYTLNRNARAHR